MTKVIILQHDGGEMGNQLWNYASIYAYCVEKGFVCENWSFFEYARFFSILPKSRVISWLFFLPFREHSKRKSAPRVKLFRALYKVFVVRVASFFWREHVIYSCDGVNDVYYLPPTIASTSKLLAGERIMKIIFFSQVNGGVFRNPVGLQSHQRAIKEYFRPSLWVRNNVVAFMASLRAQNKTIVGVHIRQGDYVMFKEGKFTMSPERVREIFDEYLVFSQKSSEEVIFIVASDGSVDKKIFEGLHVAMSKGSAGEDLFILASCDAIIGSDSTFGHFAAYYGDIPHIVMKNEPIDWEYYRNKNSYFINKYLTVMLV